MRRWTAGAASGDWSWLIAVLIPDVTFHVPVAGFAVLQHGTEAATRYFDHLSAAVRGPRGHLDIA